MKAPIRLWLALLLAGATPLAAATATPEPAPASAQDPAPDVDWDDYEIDPIEPDFVVVNLPTTLRLPKHRLAFRITHRFARGLTDGDFGDLLGDFFGFDGGAETGLGLRFGLLDGTQLEVYRSSNKTIQFQLDHSLLRQGSSPLGVSLRLGIEGRDNFSEEYSPNAAVVLSRKLGQRAALYAVPTWVGNARFGQDDESSLILGVGARLLLADGVAVTGEWHPRVAGVTDRRNIYAFGIEKRVGGHAFQINFSNDLVTTPGQIARGQLEPDDLFIGFNITRKFY
jgi:hypothetical protein